MGLHLDRMIWWRLVAIAEANSEIPERDFLLSWMRRMYASRAVVGIRSLVDRGKGTRSFLRLLEEIKRHSGDLTVDSTLSHWNEPDDSVLARDTFFREFDPEHRGCVDARLVARDIAQLKGATDPIVDFTNAVIAHDCSASLSRVAPPPKLALEVVDGALAELERILKRYSLLLTYQVPDSAEPTVQFNWEAALTVAWKSGTTSPM